ncbi:MULTISPECIES: DUF2577 domain-containing protein [unclassified Lactobacillus]|uniref:DUF2577 domain-containing protein n=1 Tax=unclassified Lactobacillus TaxID=2620435 RepID=UPI000BEEFBAC|nr:MULTISPECIES: DUF2577 domain-containing protein [unclassified Lactobacillus]PEG86829.1 hypothetical protein CP365_05805 [Lactobacillus sp. UMNPBX14]PEH02378.1 hypothetical protein CP357_05805 [Lactobacillus sp. UMNPBX6]
MAGKRLYELMTKRGGKPSDYSDVVYGTVISAKPLKVQLSNNMVLTDDFIVLGKHIGKFKLQGKAIIKGIADMNFDGKEGKATITKSELEFKKKKMYIEFDNSLEKGDKVTMIRLDGGQQFYLFERLGEDGFGF